MAKCDSPCWQQWPKLQVPCSPYMCRFAAWQQLCRIRKVHDQPSPTICNNLRLYSTSISPLAAHSHLLSMTHMSCILVMIVDLTSHKHSHQDGWHQNVDRILTKFDHVQTKHFLLPSIVVDDVIASGSGSAGFSCPLSDYQSRPTARTGNNLRLSNMGTSPSAFRWHLLSMMHMSCILLMISCCSLTLQKCQSDLVSIPGLCLPSSTTASTSLLAFSAFRICRRCIGQHTHWHPNGWQDMTKFGKFGHVQTKHCFFPSKPLNCDRWCHSKWQWFCGIQLSTIRLSAKTARTGSNLKLSNMGTSPFTFRWHLLSMMHMSCILLMISCYWPTLQKRQSGLVSVPRFWLQSSTTASACLLDFSVARICRWWIRHLMSRIWNGLRLLMVLISQSTGMWHLSESLRPLF